MYWDATYRVTTPLFLGGTDPGTSVELRPTAIKGLLRFWFRALALPQIKNWGNVKSLEDNIFGSTKKQSSFFLTILRQEGLIEKKTGDNWRGHHGLLYLGRGVVEEKRMRQQKRTEIKIHPYLEPEGNFTYAFS